MKSIWGRNLKNCLLVENNFVWNIYYPMLISIILTTESLGEKIRKSPDSNFQLAKAVSTNSFLSMILILYT